MSDSVTSPKPNDPLDPASAAIIKSKARRLVGRSGLRAQDRADLEQELSLHVFQKRPRFNPRRGSWTAFVRRVVERYGENLVRARRTAKRYGGPTDPLTDAVPARDENDARARAVLEAVAGLPAELREVAELVLSGSVAAAARELGVSRSTVYARLREIRFRTEFAELDPDP